MEHAYWAETDEASIPLAARRVRLHWRAIVRAITRKPGELQVMTTVACLKRPGRQPCPGMIVGNRILETDDLAWACPACGAGGVISNWQGCPDDWSRSEIATAPKRTMQTREIHLSVHDFDTLARVEIFAGSTAITALMRCGDRRQDGATIRGSYADLVELRHFIAGEFDAYMRNEEERTKKRVIRPPRGSSAEQYARILALLNIALE